MNSYILHFAVYTFAMIGFIVMALFVYKKTMYAPKQANSKNFLNIETSIKLSATKTIYVIKAGQEKFLIAGDTANTTMLAKLEDQNNTEYTQASYNDSIQELPLIRKPVQKINRG